MLDDRILSAQERALVATLLQHAKAATGENQETQQAVGKVIASAVGETVAQRAFAALGGSIVDRILENSSLPAGNSGGVMKQPQPPRTPMGVPDDPPTPVQPQPPRSPMPPTPQKPPLGPVRDDPPPPVQPQPPRGSIDREIIAQQNNAQQSNAQNRNAQTTAAQNTAAQNQVATLERPSHLTARCVVLDEFLAPEELDQLTRFTLDQEQSFSASEVLSPLVDGGVVNYEHRRSRVLMDLQHYQGLILDRVKAALPQVLDKLGMEEFAIAGSEAQITASNDGDFFRFHSDNGSDRVASRQLTFVYFFHREPRQFEGGDLRIHDARLEGGSYISEGSYQTIVPQQNQIVFFPCELLHEITPVKCPSGRFADSRFTLNGWLRR